MSKFGAFGDSTDSTIDTEDHELGVKTTGEYTGPVISRRLFIAGAACLVLNGCGNSEEERRDRIKEEYTRRSIEAAENGERLIHINSILIKDIAMGYNTRSLIQRVGHQKIDNDRKYVYANLSNYEFETVDTSDSNIFESVTDTNGVTMFLYNEKLYHPSDFLSYEQYTEFVDGIKKRYKDLETHFNNGGVIEYDGVELSNKTAFVKTIGGLPLVFPNEQDKLTEKVFQNPNTKEVIYCPYGFKSKFALPMKLGETEVILPFNKKGQPKSQGTNLGLFKKVE